MNYIARVTERIDNSPRGWDYIRIGVFDIQDGVEQQIGSYVRNYPTLFKTFYAFKKNGRDYALYSPDYTGTRVLELPSCTDLGGEERNPGGFCPTQYYVPWNDNDAPDELAMNAGFVAGCHWGDDTSWKIQFLDLSEVDEGIIKRDDRFGYIELPDKCELAQIISARHYEPEDEDYYISIGIQKDFDLRTGKRRPEFSGWRDIDDSLNQVVDLSTFLDFVRGMVADRRYDVALQLEQGLDSLGRGPRGWQNHTIEHYLEAAIAWTEATRGGAESVGEEAMWREFARFLYTGKFYR
jgi:hypothetical protein